VGGEKREMKKNMNRNDCVYLSPEWI